MFPEEAIQRMKTNKQASKSQTFSNWKLSTNQRFACNLEGDIVFWWKINFSKENQHFPWKFSILKQNFLITPTPELCYIFLSTIYWCCIIN